MTLTPVPAQPAGWRERLPGTDLVALMRGGITEPRRLVDGLLYAGALHTLNGEPEFGKTTVAADWAARMLAAQNLVVWMDEESGREALADKFLSLGVNPDDVVNGLHYVEFPGLGWADPDLTALRGLLDEIQPSLIVFDSASGFLGAAGLAENDNDAVGQFYKRVLLRAARHNGAAVVVLDHLSKSAESGGRYARGASSKLGYVDVAYGLERIRPFSRADSGALRLIVRKDRRGWLHRQHDIVVDVDNGQMSLRYEEAAPGAADDTSPAGRKLLEALTDVRVPMTNAGLVDAVAARHGHGLKRETVSREMNALLRKGVVDCLDDGDGKRKLWLLKGCDEPVMTRDSHTPHTGCDDL